jgi:ubiquinone/menaquinone biosynthesis C-methylase UbiE
VLLIRGKFTVADLAGLPLPDGCMDLIVSTASLHHWTDASTVIVSLDRALRPDGRI